MDQYGAFSRVYDQIYAAKNYRDYARFVLRIVSGQKSPVSSVLDVGCGTGTLLGYLQKKIPKCMGVDPSAAMLKHAKAKNPKIRYKKDDILSLGLQEKFDVALCTFDVLNYLPTKRQLNRAIGKIRLHLNEHSVFIGDFNTPNKIFTEHFSRKGVDFESTQTMRTWKVRIRIPKERGFVTEEHTERLYSRDEMEAALTRAGFKRIAWYKSFSVKQSKDEKSPRLIFVAWL